VSQRVVLDARGAIDHDVRAFEQSAARLSYSAGRDAVRIVQRPVDVDFRPVLVAPSKECPPEGWRPSSHNLCSARVATRAVTRGARPEPICDGGAGCMLAVESSRWSRGCGLPGFAPR